MRTVAPSRSWIHSPTSMARPDLSGNAMKRQEPPSHEQDFEEFYRSSYRPLLRDVIVAGGNPHEAEDALSAAMVEVIQRWDKITNPHAYARRAAISNLIKNKHKRQTFRPLVRVQVAGRRHPGWIHLPEHVRHYTVTQLADYQRFAV